MQEELKSNTARVHCQNYFYNEVVVVGSQLVHYSMKKAIDILGFGVRGLVTMLFDKSYCVHCDFFKVGGLKASGARVAAIVMVGCGNKINRRFFCLVWQTLLKSMGSIFTWMPFGAVLHSSPRPSATNGRHRTSRQCFSPSTARFSLPWGQVSCC